MRIPVLALGIVFLAILLAGCTQSSPAATTAIPTAAPTTVAAISSAGPGSQVSVAPGSVTVPVATPIAIPATGIFVYVNYLGSFSGSFGSITNMTTVQDSGERLYYLDPVNGTINAGFAKLNRSSHPIEVRIYEAGRIVKTGTSSAPDGMVNITADQF